MINLFLVLVPIALVDSSSIIPLCIVPLVILLGGPRPLGRSMSLLFGIFLTYIVVGLLILFGLQHAFDAIDDYMLRLWQHPNSEELIFQILVGLVLVFFGFRMARGRQVRAKKPAPVSVSAGQAFLAGVGMAIVGIPGAVPYLAAIDLIIRSELPSDQAIVLVFLYNIIFVAPLVVIVVVRQVAGDRSQGFLDRVRSFLSRWGRRVVVALMLAVGFVLVADGIGWFLGTPLIPV